MKFFKYIFALVIFFMMLSCTTSVKKFVEVKPKSETDSVLYVYRPDSMSNIMVYPGVFIDGKKQFAINNNSYSYYHIKPGKHIIKILVESKYSGIHEVGFIIEPGEVKYIRISTGLKFEMHRPYSRSFNVEAVTSTQAKVEIQKLKHKGKDKRFSSKSQIKGAGDSRFSIQKTNNPFSK